MRFVRANVRRVFVTSRQKPVSSLESRIRQMSAPLPPPISSAPAAGAQHAPPPLDPTRASAPVARSEPVPGGTLTPGARTCRRKFCDMSPILWATLPNVLYSSLHLTACLQLCVPCQFVHSSFLYVIIIHTEPTALVGSGSAGCSFLPREF